MDSQSRDVPNDTFELRRARWGAAGVAADQALNRHAVMVMITLVCGFLVAAAVTFYGR